jgi:hypothetical protein
MLRRGVAARTTQVYNENLPPHLQPNGRRIRDASALGWITAPAVARNDPSAPYSNNHQVMYQPQPQQFPPPAVAWQPPPLKEETFEVQWRSPYQETRTPNMQPPICSTRQIPVPVQYDQQQDYRQPNFDASNPVNYVATATEASLHRGQHSIYPPPGPAFNQMQQQPANAASQPNNHLQYETDEFYDTYQLPREGLSLHQRPGRHQQKPRPGMALSERPDRNLMTSYYENASFSMSSPAFTQQGPLKANQGGGQFPAQQAGVLPTSTITKYHSDPFGNTTQYDDGSSIREDWNPKPQIIFPNIQGVLGSSQSHSGGIFSRQPNQSAETTASHYGAGHLMYDEWDPQPQGIFPKKTEQGGIHLTQPQPGIFSQRGNQPNNDSFHIQGEPQNNIGIFTPRMSTNGGHNGNVAHGAGLFGGQGAAQATRLCPSLVDQLRASKEASGQQRPFQKESFQSTNGTIVDDPFALDQHLSEHQQHQTQSAIPPAPVSFQSRKTHPNEHAAFDNVFDTNSYQPQEGIPLFQQVESKGVIEQFKKKRMYSECTAQQEFSARDQHGISFLRQAEPREGIAEFQKRRKCHEEYTTSGDFFDPTTELETGSFDSNAVTARRLEDPVQVTKSQFCNPISDNHAQGAGGFSPCKSTPSDPPCHPVDNAPSYDAPPHMRFFLDNTETDIHGRPLSAPRSPLTGDSELY